MLICYRPVMRLAVVIFLCLTHSVLYAATLTGSSMVGDGNQPGMLTGQAVSLDSIHEGRNLEPSRLASPYAISRTEQALWTG
jgi:hypothetical protein